MNEAGKRHNEEAQAGPTDHLTDRAARQTESARAAATNIVDALANRQAASN